MYRKQLFLAVACALTALSTVSQAQRLSGDVKPEHYTLKLSPDLKAATFQGEETIDVTLPKPSTSITLNAIEIKFGTVTITAGGKDQSASVSLNENDQQATFNVPETIPA